MNCPICNSEFEPRDSRQKCCSKACGATRYGRSVEMKKLRKSRYYKNHAEIRAKTKERYWTDEEYRAKHIEWARQKRERHPEKVRAINAKYRMRPENRLRAAEKSKQWHAANHEYANPRRIVRKQHQRNHRPWIILVNAAKARAKKFGIIFDLTHEWAYARWTGKCELTDIPFQLGLRGFSGKMFSPSIDKIDPKLGYVKSNCRFILHCVNTFKYTGTDAEIYAIAEALIAYRARLMSTPAQNAETLQAAE